jgi:hypothetical protein
MRMARLFPLTTFLCGVAITLGACATVPDPLYLLDWHNLLGSHTVAEPDEMPTPVEPVSLETNPAYMQQIRDLDADNLKLRKQLVDALLENAKLKKQLNEAMEDNSLLKDLAARKMR